MYAHFFPSGMGGRECLPVAALASEMDYYIIIELNMYEHTNIIVTIEADKGKYNLC